MGGGSASSSGAVLHRYVAKNTTDVPSKNCACINCENTPLRRIHVLTVGVISKLKIVVLARTLRTIDMLAAS